MKTPFLAVTLLGFTSILTSLDCGGSSGTATDAGGDASADVRHDTGAGPEASREAGHDAPADAAPDGGGSDAPPSFPAFLADYPQVFKNAGVVMASPVIVTVSWPGDTQASTWEAFGDSIGASDYWKATTSEYGVGPATSGAKDHVRMKDALPASLTYFQLNDFVTATLGGTPDGGVPDAGSGGGPNPPWPAPTLDKGQSQTIYALYIPTSTAVTDPGSGYSFCTEGGLGYHQAVTVGGVKVTYAVILQCQNTAGIEETAAHEYVETATDPTSQGYFGFDPAHLAYDLFTGLTGDELADACQAFQDSYYQDKAPFPYWVQRSWSNAAAKKGAYPCVPAPSTPTYGVTLLPGQTTEVTVNVGALFGGSGSGKTQGFEVSVGTPLTFEIGYYSDAPLAPWTIAYQFPAQAPLYETGSYAPVDNGEATVKIDKMTGKNGDKANVTVTVIKEGNLGFHLMALTWDPATASGYLPHFLPIVLVDK